MEIEHFCARNKIGFMRGLDAIIFDPKTRVVASYYSYGFISSPDPLSHDLVAVGATPQEIMEAVDKWHTSRT